MIQSATPKITFCPIHGSLLKPVLDTAKLTDENGHHIELANNSRLFKCPFCNFELIFNPEIKHSSHDIKKKITKNKTFIDDGKSDYDVRGTIDVTCPKCSHAGAHVQMVIANESETLYYECLACKHKWREND
jgi:DNA-directed RNA polymerase subunit M/transcription elongation factor TFIIS